MASLSEPLYAGTSLTLTCNTKLDGSVDNGEVVNTVWTGPDGTTLSDGGRLTITDAMDSVAPYNSMIVYSPLNLSDSGMHSCQVTVNPGAGRGRFVTASDPETDELYLTVLCELPMFV